MQKKRSNDPAEKGRLREKKGGKNEASSARPCPVGESAPPAAEQRLIDIIEFLPDATFVIDQDKRIIAWNRACEVLTGVKKEGLLGRGDYAYAEPFFGERHPILIDLLDSPSSEIEAKYKYVRREGDTIFAESYIPRLKGGRGAHLWGSASPLFDRSGRRCGAIEVIRDMTAQKLAEQALRESERKYRELVENASSIILRWTPEGRISFLNEFGQRFFGYMEAELLGRHVLGTIVPPSESGGRDLKSLMDEICGNPAEFEQNINENMRRNGEHVWIAWTNKIVFDAQGRVVEILSIGQDITARQKAEDELKAIKLDLERRVEARTRELAAANARLIELDRLKSLFLASMSHELRTPLNSILGFTGLLLMGMSGALNDEQAKQLTMVQNSATHLLELINEVLDISKIESGRVTLDIESFPIAELMDETLRAVMPLAQAKGMELAADVPELIILQSDRRRVKQVLMNLLGNAIKFSDPGRIDVRAGIVGGRLSISVSDRGIGISAENIKKLFKPFEQIDMSSTKSYEGTGLGLYQCKKILALLHGDITVKSDFGRGSVFTFDLPLAWKENADEDGPGY